MALTIGTQLGSHEITALLGKGGMGEVYRARDLKLKREVAIKILPEEFSRDADRVTRFQREAEVLASLNHPNIAAIHDLEEISGARFLVLELVEGDTLADRIARGRIPVEEALGIAKQIVEALEAAHERGVIHRDLKPANIKVTEEGKVKVLDFGLAKVMESTTASATVSNSPTMVSGSMAGMIVGTAAYMSPEQAKGRPVDRRTDIFAFGCVLYEMLTGKQAFDGDDSTEILGRVVTAEPDWSKLPVETPPAIQRLIRRALKKDIRQRLGDIHDAKLEIDDAINEPPSATKREEAPMRSSRAAWVIASVAVLTAGMLAIPSWRGLRSAETFPQPVTLSRMELKDVSGFLNVSRDGTKIAYAVTGGPHGTFISVRQTEQLESKPVAGADEAEFPIFSPDAVWIAYSGTSKMQILKIPAAGGAPIVVCDGNFDSGADWGDDDTIVFSGPQGLLRVPASGGKPRQLTTVDHTKGEVAHSRPQFLPGGKQLLFTITSNTADRPLFAVLNLARGDYHILMPGGDGGRYVPSGHLTFVRNGTLFGVPIDPATLKALGPEAPLAAPVSSLGPAGTADYAFSRNGLMVYSEGMPNEGTTLMWADRTGNLQVVPGQSPRVWGTGRLSPDGVRLVNSVRAGKDSDIWVVELRRGIATRLTFGGGNGHPIWDPNGRRVIYGSALSDGKFGLYSVPADGSAKPELLLSTEQFPNPSSFTPDGKTLLYQQSDERDNWRIFQLALASHGVAGIPHLLRDSASSDRDAQVSPDGKWVAFASNETGSSEIYVMSFPEPGGKTRVSTAGGRDPRWNQNGHELLFWNNVTGAGSLVAVPIQTAPFLVAGAPHELFHMVGGSTWDVVPGGERFIVESPRGGEGASRFVTVTNWFDELRRRAPARN